MTLTSDMAETLLPNDIPSNDKRGSEQAFSLPGQGLTGYPTLAKLQTREHSSLSLLLENGVPPIAWKVVDRPDPVTIKEMAVDKLD